MSIWLIALLFFAVAAGWGCARVTRGWARLQWQRNASETTAVPRESYHRLERMFLVVTEIMYK